MHDPRTGIVRRPRDDRAANASYHPRTTSARTPHGLRTSSVEILRRLSDDCTEIARFPCNLPAASVRICPDQSLNNSYKNRTIIVYNVNTYAVARSHLRCLKNRTQNRRRSYRTAPVANVNQALVTNPIRTPYDDLPAYFLANRAGDRSMIHRSSGHFGASGGGRRNFKSYLKQIPTSGPFRNRVGIELKSDDHRPVIERHRGHRTCAGENQGVAKRNLYRPVTVRSPGDYCPETEGQRKTNIFVAVSTDPTKAINHSQN